MQHDLHNHGDPKIPIEFAGKRYMVSGMKLKWIVDLEQHVLERNIAAAIAAMNKQAMTPGDRARVIAETAARGLSQTDVWAELMTGRGMRFILWCAISETDKSMTLEQIEQTLVTQEELLGLVQIIHLMGNRMMPDTGAATETDPTTASPSSGMT